MNMLIKTCAYVEPLIRTFMDDLVDLNNSVSTRVHVDHSEPGEVNHVVRNPVQTRKI